MGARPHGEVPQKGGDLMTQQVQTNLSHLQAEHRLGLVPLQVGRNIMHRLGIAIDLQPPLYSTEQRGMIPRLRIKVAAKPTPYEVDPITGVRTRALKGALIELQVQDFNMLEEELQRMARWTCRHPDCLMDHAAGWPTKADLIRDHGDQKQLLAESKQAINARPHLYYAVLEVAGVQAVPEKKDTDGRIAQKARSGSDAIVMILSEEL